MTSTAERIAETITLIERLEADLGAARAAEERSQAVRAEHALAAAEGSAHAQKLLAEASHAAAVATIDAENAGLALAAARQRLAELEAQAETERIAREREEALAVCDERREAAQRVDQALADLAAAMIAWQATTPILQRYGKQGQEWLSFITVNGFEYFPNAVVHAAGHEFAERMGFRHVAYDTMLPLVETDAVLFWAQRERGEEVDTRSPEAKAKDAEPTPWQVALAHMGMTTSTADEAPAADLDEAA